MRRESGVARVNALQDLLNTVHTGAVERIRLMAMAGLANILGLLPTMS